MGPRDPLELLDDAERLARAHNMFVVHRGGRFLLFRRTRVRPVFLGGRSDAAAFSSLVSRCTTSRNK